LQNAAGMKLLMISILMARAGIALADAPGEVATASAAPDAVSTWPGQLTQRPLTLASGLGELELDGATTSSDGTMSATFGFAAAYGLTDRLELEADRHCVVVDGCQTHQTGVHAKYGVVRSHRFEVAAVAGLEVYDVDPYVRWALRLGATFELRSGHVALVAAPSVKVALGVADGFEQNSILLPVALEYQATPSLALYARTGIDGWMDDGGAPLFAFSSNYAVPVAAGALINVAPCCDVGVELANLYAAGPGAEAASVSQFTMYGQLWL
jgi:hypothetical protein